MPTDEIDSLAALKELSTASGASQPNETDTLADMAKQIAILKEQLVESKKPSTMAKALATQAIKAKKELATHDEIILQFKSAYKKEIADREKEYFEQLEMLKGRRAELAQNANTCRVWGDEPDPASESDGDLNDGQEKDSVNGSVNVSVNDSVNGSVNDSAHGSDNYRESYTQVVNKRSPKYTSNGVPKKPEPMANCAPKHAYKKKCTAGASCHFRIICVNLHTPEEMALFEKEHEDWCEKQYANNTNFRSQKCDNMVKPGYCPHGRRCHFKHPNDKIAGERGHQQSYH